MIKVSKEGIKAAAATAIDIANRAGKSETTKVVINKPFLFTISLAKERNQNSKSDDAAIQTQLFMGSVSEINPVQSWFHKINQYQYYNNYEIRSRDVKTGVIIRFKIPRTLRKWISYRNSPQSQWLNLGHALSTHDLWVTILRTIAILGCAIWFSKKSRLARGSLLVTYRDHLCPDIFVVCICEPVPQYLKR